MKTIQHYGKKDKLLHIETPLGVINITVGLMDLKGRQVESIEIIPSNYPTEQKVIRKGLANTRLIQLKVKNK